MECKEISNLIMKYLDGDISAEEMNLLDKHKLNCEKCDKEFQIMTDMVQCISELPEVTPPFGLEAKILKQINGSNTRSSVVNMLIGTAGMFVFAYYMIIFITLPFIREMNIVETILDYGIFALNLIVTYLMNLMVYLPIAIENLLIVRNILVDNYLNFMLLVVAATVAMNISLIKILNFQRE